MNALAEARTQAGNAQPPECRAVLRPYVHDIQAARSALTARGAVFVIETVDYGPLIIARLRDPSGNMFNIFQGG